MFWQIFNKGITALDSLHLDFIVVEKDDFVSTGKVMIDARYFKRTKRKENEKIDWWQISIISVTRET